MGNDGNTMHEDSRKGHVITSEMFAQRYFNFSTHATVAPCPLAPRGRRQDSRSALHHTTSTTYSLGGGVFTIQALIVAEHSCHELNTGLLAGAAAAALSSCAESWEHRAL